MALGPILVYALPLMVGSALGASVADEAAVYECDMSAFVRTIDDGYPFLVLKGIGDDWADAKLALMQRAKRCTSDEEFLRIVIDAIRVLRDGHIRIRESRAKLPDVGRQHYPGVSFLPATGGRVTVMHAPRDLGDRLGTGTVVTKIDGTDARRYLEQRSEAAWKEGGFFSSPQRARLFEYRLALRGEQGQKHTIHYLDGDEEKTLTVVCETVVRGWPHTYNLPGDLKRVGRSFFYTRLADDVGYMYLRRVDTLVPQGIGEALRTYPKLKGWIFDLRGNSGGGYDRGLIERIKGFPRPVAVLIDAGCISAGETLARDFRAYAAARLFGSTSAGSSSAKRTWSFPSGIASIQLPVRSRWRHDRKPIEFNGIDPDIQVEAVPEELKAGDNSAILRAQEYIGREAEQRGFRGADPASGRADAGDSALLKWERGDDVAVWYKLLPDEGMGRRVVPRGGVLIPVFRIDGDYYSVCRGFEIPFKECPEGLAWALEPSSMSGTTIGCPRPGETCLIRIVDRQRADDFCLPDEMPPLRMTRVEEPAGLLDATARGPRALDDFLGFYQPIWLPWVRMEIHKDGRRYLCAEEGCERSGASVVWKASDEPRELMPLVDALGFAGGSEKSPHHITYSKARKRFELVKVKLGIRMPLARVSSKDGADLPSIAIGIPAWH